MEWICVDGNEAAARIAYANVAARAIATHALSIFGDPSDVMHARSTGWAMLCASSVQEAQDFALVAHAATLRARVPFLHFFDGFRTSHEINGIVALGEADVRALIRDEHVIAHRLRGLTPDAPVLRGTAQNPDVFFQAREAANPFYDATPGIVAEVMDEFAARTGRSYGLVEYVGAPDASRVVVLMGSAAGAAEEAVEALTAAGEPVGLLKVRLYRPFPSAELIRALPPSVRAVAVLDRTKEPGAPAEPLHLDVLAALDEAMGSDDPPFAAAPPGHRRPLRPRLQGVHAGRRPVLRPRRRRDGGGQQELGQDHRRAGSPPGASPEG